MGANWTKNVCGSKGIRYQVIMEPIMAELLSSMPKNPKSGNGKQETSTIKRTETMNIINSKQLLGQLNWRNRA